jgi:hypothetical protein
METQSAADKYKREHHIRLLRGAVAEYLDQDMIEELLEDLHIVLREEQKEFSDRAKVYRKFRKLIPKPKTK